MRFGFWKGILIGVYMACVTTPFVAANDKSPDYKPQIHGVFRGRYEMELHDGYSRFQVRNARMSMQGFVAPTIDYFVQVDFSNNGKFLFLDAYGRVALGHGWKIQAGQFRMPFGVEPARGPFNYLFSNRSFLGKRAFNYRAVGAKFIFDTHVDAIPLTIEGGVFNSASTVDHTVWQKKYNYSGKALLKIDNVTVGAGIGSVIPDSVRINAVDFSLGYKIGCWALEGEGLFKKYTHDSHESAWAYVATADYGIPVKWGDFNMLSFQGRFDGMTDHSIGTRNNEGILVTDDQARNRVTLGSTLSCMRGPVHADVRLNYEKYFYRDNDITPSGTDDRISLELIVRF